MKKISNWCAHFFNWMVKLFASKEVEEPKLPPQKKKYSVDVGKSIVTIFNKDNNIYKCELIGYIYSIPNFMNNLMFTSKNCFDQWKSKAGETGLLVIEDGKYIPLCNIKEITVIHKPYNIEIEL